MLFIEEYNDTMSNTVSHLENSINASLKHKGKPLFAAVNSQGYKETSFIDIRSMGKDHLPANRQEVLVEAKSTEATTKVHDFNTVKSQQQNIIVQEQLKLQFVNKIHDENSNLERNHFAYLEPNSSYLAPFHKATSNLLSHLQVLRKTKVHRWNTLILKEKNPSNKKEAVIEISKQFCNECSIDAAQHLVCKLYRKIWAIFFILVIFYCLYQCKLNIDKYLQYELSITVAEETVSTTDFPAITICPMSTNRKSTIGKTVDFGLTYFYSNTRNKVEMEALHAENRKSCYVNSNIPQEEGILRGIDYVVSYDNGSIWLTNKYFMSYQDYLLKCFWNNKNVDCENAFINHVSDTAVCFTFNPGENFAQFTNDAKIGYGINLSTYEEPYFKTYQGQRGLKLYMTVNQEEYCGNDNLKRGAGFYFQVHGLNRSPSFILNPSTYLNPGYDIEVNIAKKVYKRNTEHLGNCTKFVKLYMTPNVTFYVQEHCFMQCVTEYILKTCKCYPPNVGAFKDSFKSRVKEFNLTEEDVKMCYDIDFVCMKLWQFNDLSHSSMNVLCPYCKQPCEETRYTATMTSLLLSRRNLEISEFRNISFEQLQKNYAIVTFNLQTSYVEKIIEDQKFKTKDLFIYMGNNIGLYLGMSFTTSFEILYFIIEILVCLCKR